MKKIVKSVQKRPINLVLIIVVLVAYFINNHFLKGCTNGIIQHFFICYFNDLICPLLFFSYANILLITVGREIRQLWVVVLISAIVSCIWEFVAPFLKPSSVTDMFDIMCYVAGGIVYWIILSLITKRASKSV